MNKNGSYAYLRAKAWQSPLIKIPERVPLFRITAKFSWFFSGPVHILQPNLLKSIQQFVFSFCVIPLTN